MVTTGALVVGAAVGAFVVAGGIVTVVLVVPFDLQKVKIYGQKRAQIFQLQP